jgi:hypothetical protein
MADTTVVLLCAGLDGHGSTCSCAAGAYRGARVHSFRPVGPRASCLAVILCLRFPGKAGGCQMDNLELESHGTD